LPVVGDRARSTHSDSRAVTGRPSHDGLVPIAEKSRPLIDTFEPWLRVELGLINQKSNLRRGHPLRPVRLGWADRFTDDGGSRSIITPEFVRVPTVTPSIGPPSSR
jgi:hypothetical protein